MPDLHGWITQQIDQREDLAKRAAHYGRPDWPQPCTAAVDTGEDWPITTEAGPIAEHIAMHDPGAVLRRCAADRKILARHNVDPNKADDWIDATACVGCGTYGEMDHSVTDNLSECPELLDLAEGYGLTEEQRAGLDRPEPERPEPRPGFLIPDAFNAGLLRAFIGTRPMEPSPEEKAVQILEPELRKIGIYVPGAEG
jgi:hypothetical protein